MCQLGLTFAGVCNRLFPKHTIAADLDPLRSCCSWLGSKAVPTRLDWIWRGKGLRLKPEEWWFNSSNISHGGTENAVSRVANWKRSSIQTTWGHCKESLAAVIFVVRPPWNARALWLLDRVTQSN